MPKAKWMKTDRRNRTLFKELLSIANYSRSSSLTVLLRYRFFIQRPVILEKLYEFNWRDEPSVKGDDKNLNGNVYGARKTRDKRALFRRRTQQAAHLHITKIERREGERRKDARDVHCCVLTVRGGNVRAHKK